MKLVNPDGTVPGIDARELARAEEQVGRALGRGATRRDVLRMLMAGGFAATTAGAFLRSAGEAFAATPRKGGHLKLAGYSTSAKDTLDPALAAYSNDYMRVTTFYDLLVETLPNGQAGPRLAKSFEGSNGARTWVFDLQEGVTFHNGKSLTSADVVFSLLRHKDPAVASAASALAEQIDSVEADGKHRVIVKLKNPNADFPIMLSTFHFGIVAEGTTDFTTANGTGPYKLVEWQPGVKSIGERNEDYFGDAYVDSIEHFAITDGNARTNAVITGEVDLVIKLDANTLDAVNDSGTAKVFNTPCPRFVELVMQSDVSPYDNVDFRNALKWLFDRERLVKTTLKGYGAIANDHPFHPDSEYYNSGLEQRGLDIDRAKSLIRKAGMDGSRLELHVSDAAAGSVDMGLMLQQTAARAGLTIDLKREPSDGYWSNIWLKRAFIGSEWNARPSYDLILSILFKSDAKWNEDRFRSDRLDSLIIEARATLDAARRKEIYGEAQSIIYNGSGHVIPAFADYLDGVANRVKGLTPVPVGNMGGFNLANKVWLES
jgi:peptide/nickel transport system substrate-binding protein